VAIGAVSMTNDDHPESDRRSLSQQLQAAWTRVPESADLFQRVAASLPDRLPSRPVIPMPAIPDLSSRDWVLFGCTGLSVLLALITIAIVVADMLARP
jgi:hypothetical protein